jgi:16S rRNA (adenine1518-N6/adenine1519-N6)-dimethyltransferase
MINFKFKPKHHLGQNFLADKEVLQKIIEIAELKSSDTVLEVGPGTGVLTEELLKTAKEVWAVEKDEKLFLHLKNQFSLEDKLKLVNQDILRFHLERNIPGDYKVVANIPYYLTSKLLQHFLEQKNPPKLLVLMVQKEVGERVVAAPGELSILGLSVQIYADAEIAAHVSRKSFWPVPEVDSAILKITPTNKYPQIKDKELFFRIIKIAFAGKRKQILNSLKNGLKLSREEIEKILAAAGIQIQSRPQDLTIDQWISLNEQILLFRRV